MARVVIENLVKIYPEKTGPGVRAVNSIGLTVEDREFMVLVGPSGCGKSTTLRMIAGHGELVIYPGAGHLLDEAHVELRELLGHWIPEQLGS